MDNNLHDISKIYLEMIKREHYDSVDESSYHGNIGFMEVTKFFKVADDKQKRAFNNLLSQGKKSLAWKLVQGTLGVKLQGKEFGNG